MPAKPKVAPNSESRAARLQRLLKDQHEKEQDYAAAKQTVAIRKQELAAIQLEVAKTMHELEEIEGLANSRRRRSVAPSVPTAASANANADANADADADADEGRRQKFEEKALNGLHALMADTIPTLKARVLEVLREKRGPMSAAQVAAALGDGIAEKSVFYTLQSIRSRDPKRLIKPGRGFWQLREEAS